MSSSSSTVSNPFAGPDVTLVRDLNIHERVLVKLDQNTASYSAWKRYFSLVFRECLLHGHVDGTVDSALMINDEDDLFHTVVNDDDDAYAVWTKLNGLFTDNRLQRKVLLHGEFYGCQQLDSSIDDFCMRLKKLADELHDLGETIGDALLISTLTAGQTRILGTPPPTSPSSRSLPSLSAYLKLEERRMRMARTRATHTALVAGTRGDQAPPPLRRTPPQPAAPAFPPAPAAPFPPPQPAANGGGRRGGRKQGGAGAQGGAPRPPQPAYQPAPWYAGQNPWTGVVHAYSMPAPRAPAPGILGARPPSHQAFYAAPQPYAAPYAVPYGQQPQPGGLPLLPLTAPPQPLPPAPWDPALLAALHTAPFASSYTGGGEWYMDTGATAHMAAYPGRSHADGAPPM
nr:translation initiation factor IF-2-like [Aegilops tauschii subsp. strangulata]